LEILRRLDAQPIDVIQALAPHLNAESENLQSFVRSWFRQHDNAGANESPLKPVNYEDYAEYVRKIKTPPDAFVNYIFERSPERALIVFYQNHVRHGPDAVAAAAAALQAEAREFEAARQGLEPPDGPRSRPKVREPRSNQVKGVLLGVRTVENAIWLRRNGFVDKFQEALPEAQERLAELSDREEWWVRLYVVEIMRRHREFRQVAVLDKLSDDSSSCVRKAAKAAGG
jgi:hypothetical protein